MTNSPNDSDFARMEGELFHRITVRHRRQVARHRLVGAAVLVVLAGTGVAAGTVANASQQRNSATCYSADSSSSKSGLVAGAGNVDLAARSGVRPTAAQVAHVVSLCETGWEAGAFGWTPAKPPKLQACLQDNLVIAVFPKKNASLSANAFCTKLGLTAP